MPRGRQSKGRCAYCKAEITKSGTSRHLSACQKRQAVIEKAQAMEKVESEVLFHLRVQDAYRV
jgi:hypothetical protein